MDNSKAFEIIMEKLAALESAVKAMNAKNGFSKLISEQEAMIATGLGKESLRAYRRDGIFTGKTSTGRNIQYVRKEIEAYVNGEMSNKIFLVRESKKAKKTA